MSESRALLAWLADDHFTFLGYREYQLQDVDGEDALRAVPGTGLGILRSDQDMSASYGKLPPAVAAKAREKQLMIITKANSRATVHRPAYLDYVGIKQFDAQRRRRRRAPIPRAVQLGGVHREPDPDPGAAREGAPADQGCRLHPDEPQRQGADGHPRDLSARRAVPDVGGRAAAGRRGRAAPARAAAAAVLRPPRRLRPLPLVPGLPAARPLHDAGPRADAADPQGDDGRGDDRLHRARQRVGARAAALRRPGGPRRDPARLRRRPSSRHQLAEATRSWNDDFVGRARRAVRRGGRARGWRGCTATRSPRPTRRTSRRGSPLPTYAGWRTWATNRSGSRSTRRSTRARASRASRCSAPAPR